MDEPYSLQRPRPILPHFSYEKLGSKPPNGSLFGIIGYELTLLLQACRPSRGRAQRPRRSSLLLLPHPPPRNRWKWISGSSSFPSKFRNYNLFPLPPRCVCVGCLFFKDTEPSPLQDSSSVRQQGGLPGPPPRSPPPRIHRRPGVLPWTAQHYCPVVSGPNGSRLC
jgi:hypothetical protein